MLLHLQNGCACHEACHQRQTPPAQTHVCPTWTRSMQTFMTSNNASKNRVQPLSASSRATFYGTDAWSIHTGSCGYGQLAEDVGTGWDVAALTDSAWDYKGSCGKCKEVRCTGVGFKDGYGAYLDRTEVCYNPDASVVVMITDTCPCFYPGNYASNKRW